MASRSDFSNEVRWSRLSGEDEELLRDVVRDTGIAVHAAVVTAELQHAGKRW